MTRGGAQVRRVPTYTHGSPSRRHRLAPAVAAALLAFAVGGCGAEQRQSPPETGGSAPPRPSSASSGRADSLALVTVADGLNDPTDIEFRPGDPGRLYVAEQAGRIRIVERGRVLPQPFLDIHEQVASGGERGLLGVAFPPDHARTGIVYVHYTNLDGDTRLVRFRVVGDRVGPRSGQTLLALDQPYPNHNGGQLAFDRQGRLLIGLGDGGSEYDPDRRGQDLHTPLAKIRRLDVRRPGARWETVAYGLRNPWRFSFDRATGDLWMGDVGQDTQEEVDVLPAGQRGLPNFGWSAFDGRRRNPGHSLNPTGRLMPPVAVYTHDDGCTVIGGYVYRGRALRRLFGRYVYGDYCSGKIWSVRRVGGRVDVRSEPIELPLLTAFGEDRRGELYAVSQDGRLVAFRSGTK
jgi:glucose/arabinose dehydrogenase